LEAIIMDSDVLTKKATCKLKVKKKTLVTKRLFDIAFSFVGLVILSPALILISILIKLDSRGPLLFKQTRVGLESKPFEIYKFRTMLHSRENLGLFLTVGNDIRVTKVGRFLRKYKFDEFPQLLNVFIGDMSFVGPRPQVPKYVALFGDIQELILSIRPGITDYASIAYKEESKILAQYEDPELAYINIILPEKLKLNLKYIEEISIMTDIKLIFMTIYILLIGPY